MTTKKLFFTTLFISSLASAGHESHGGGEYGAFGFLRMLGEVSNFITSETNVNGVTPEHLNRLRSGWYDCELRIKLDAEVLFTVSEATKTRCVLHFDRQVWTKLASTKERWFAICESILKDLQLDSREGEFCKELQERSLKDEVGTL